MPCPKAVERVARALERGRRSAGRRSNGRATRRTATTRRTSRSAWRPRGTGLRSSSRRSSRRAPPRSPASPAPRRPLPASSTSSSTPAWYGELLAEILRAGPGLRRRLGRTRAERVQVEMVSANPTGPITVASARNGAYGDSRRAAPRVRGPRGRARVLLQRRGRADGSLPRSPSRRARRGRGAARGRLPGRVRRRAGGRSRATRCRPCSSRIEATLERFRIHFDSWVKQSELERELPSACSSASRPYESDGAVWVRSKELRRREGPRPRPLGRAGRAPDLRGRRHRLPARQARAGLRPDHLRARRRPSRRPALVSRRRAACSATTRSASR